MQCTLFVYEILFSTASFIRLFGKLRFLYTKHMAQYKPHKPFSVKYDHFHPSTSPFFRNSQPLTIAIPIATRITAAINSVNPYGQILAVISPSPYATVINPGQRRSLQIFGTQNFLCKIGTSVPGNSLDGSFQYIRKCRMLLLFLLRCVEHDQRTADIHFDLCAIRNYGIADTHKR